MTYQWCRQKGYECSSKGDKRFSALFAKLEDGRTIEMHYQCDIKGYDPGGTNWRLGKGKPPISAEITKEMLWKGYFRLWKTWAEQNSALIEELRHHAKANDNTLSDCFATTPINQAHALVEILNEEFSI